MTNFEFPAPASLLARVLQSAALRQLAMFASATQVFVIRVLGAGLAYGSMVLLARWLGSFEFGIYAYVSVILGLLGIFFSFGVSSSGLRFISSYLARGRRRRLAGFLLQSYQFVLAVSAAGAAVTAAGVYALQEVLAPYYVMPLLIGLLCVPMWALLNLFEMTARAFGWVRLAYAPGYILRPLLVIAAVGAILLFGGKADAVSALWALIAACTAAALVQGLFVWKGAHRRLAGVKPIRRSNAWVSVSLGFLAIDGLRMVLDNADILLVGKLLDPESVAIYYAVVRTGGLLAFISFAIIALAVPKFAQIHASGSREELQVFVSSTIRVMLWPTLLAGLALACVGPFVLSLFGPAFASGYPALLVVLVGLVLRSASAPVEYLLNMTGHHRDTIKVYAIAAAVSVALNLLLIPAWGLVGAAVASYAAMLGGNVCLYVLVRKRLGIRAFVVAAEADRLPIRATGNPA